MDWTEPQPRLVEVSSSRVREALARWWSLEMRFLEAMRGRDALERGVDLGAERNRLEGLTGATLTRLPDMRLAVPRPRRGRLGPTGQTRGGARPDAPGSGQRLLDESRAASTEVSNLRDLFHEWEQEDLVALMSRALELHRRIERGLALEVTTVGEEPRPEAETQTPVRFIAGVPRGPVTPWGQAP